MICAASGPVRTREDEVFNRARLFSPDGGRGAQDKLTPDGEETAVWGVRPGGSARVFETAMGRIGVLIGADVASPGIAAAMAQAGAALLLAPGRTTDSDAAAAQRAEALLRAQETGCVVVQAVVVGDVDWAAALGRSTGVAAVLGPPGSGEEGVLAEGKPDTPGWVHADAALAGSPAREGPALAGAAVPEVEVVAI